MTKNQKVVAILGGILVLAVVGKVAQRNEPVAPEKPAPVARPHAEIFADAVCENQFPDFKKKPSAATMQTLYDRGKSSRVPGIKDSLITMFDAYRVQDFNALARGSDRLQAACDAYNGGR